eukprot:CAMPEP_0170581424 /NCGR_PEP_ID=MMETSP0224-20130122/7030_1 /TAXON_ID=285029 /ORGANISM="Togula jolla, Strain CCCM 725" /LENGTH=356 /DNA_ID=CAMNT_0010904555 /DNA_START=31 /DNA_END=1101 /DNA_ORIENTATION=+
MAQPWVQEFAYRYLPYFVFVVGNSTLVFVAASIVVMVLPHSIVGQVKVLRRYRSYILKSFKRIAFLSTQGPLYRLFVWCGRRCSFGYLSSKCRPPQAMKVSPTGCSEVIAQWAPDQVALNPFHEETYVFAWRPADAKENEQYREPGKSASWEWRERPLTSNDVESVGGKRLKYLLADLPPLARVRCRVCSVNRRGRSDWSAEVEATTLARPHEEGGFIGPLGAASSGFSESRRQYRWTQSRTEVAFKAPLGDEWKAKDIKVKVTPSRLEVLYVGQQTDGEVLLAGPFPKRVKADEVFWEIETSDADGRHLSLQVTKAEQMEKWPCLIQGADHPCIDVRLVRLFTQGLDAAGVDIFD